MSKNLKIYVVNAGFFRPPFVQKLWSRKKISVNCLVIDNGDDLTIVDTGLHSRLLKNEFLSKIYNVSIGIYAEYKDSLHAWINNKFLEQREVKNVLLTHLHPDHTAGLIDFPNAQVYLSQKEWDYVKGLPKDNYYSYHFDPSHWKSVVHFNFIQKFDEQWFGFNAYEIQNLGFKIFAIELPGHTGGGHVGYAIELTKNRWILHAGDAYYLKEDLNETLHDKIFMSELVQTIISPDTALRHETAFRLKNLIHNNPLITVIVAHDENDSNQVFTE